MGLSTIIKKVRRVFVLLLSLTLSRSLNFAFSRGPGGGFGFLSLSLSLFSVDFFENFPYTRERERNLFARILTIAISLSHSLTLYPRR